MNSPLWIAQRHGQDWRCDESLNAIEWLTSMVDSQVWERRIDAVREKFEEGKRSWATGDPAALFDPADSIAWYVFQANAYASPTDRHDFFEPEGYRIAPLFWRLGQLLNDLKTVGEVDERVRTMMTDAKAKPDSSIFELLVAGAYKRRAWPSVSFVPEQGGIAKTQDLLVTKGRRRVAVECKRIQRSGYEAAEHAAGELLAKHVHEFSRRSGRNLSFQVFFKVELHTVREEYLAERAIAFVADGSMRHWQDETSVGFVVDANMANIRSVIEHDLVYFGSSRMIELVAGEYAQDFDHSFAAEWEADPAKPFYASQIHQASVVSWKMGSVEAAHKKARHFRTTVARASVQLPDDCPGVIHVGYEARDGNAADAFRHVLNAAEMKKFDPKPSRLRWVYGNYITAEHTTNRDESMAVSETTANYKVGRHLWPEPLKGHILFGDSAGVPGNNW